MSVRQVIFSVPGIPFRAIALPANEVFGLPLTSLFGDPLVDYGFNFPFRTSFTANYRSCVISRHGLIVRVRCWSWAWLQVNNRDNRVDSIVGVGIASRRSPLWRGAPVEASPQQRRRQQRCGEQWHSNGSGKGIPATTAWHSLIAVSSAFFLLSFYILLHRNRNSRSSHVNDTIISSNLFLSLALCSCEDFKRNGDRANFYRL